VAGAGRTEVDLRGAVLTASEALSGSRKAALSMRFGSLLLGGVWVSRGAPDAHDSMRFSYPTTPEAWCNDSESCRRPLSLGSKSGTVVPIVLCFCQMSTGVVADVTFMTIECDRSRRFVLRDPPCDDP
jgi:hypothetical protein